MDEKTYMYVCIIYSLFVLFVYCGSEGAFKRDELIDNHFYYRDFYSLFCFCLVLGSNFQQTLFLSARWRSMFSSLLR